MVFYIGSKFNFLKLEYFLFLFRFFISFLLLISVFSVVHDTAYRRFPVRCNFYKIKTFFRRVLPLLCLPVAAANPPAATILLPQLWT